MTVERLLPHNADDLAAFDHVTEWVFDLDNTLYPEHSNLFDQIDKRMTTYVARLMNLERDEARKIQKDFYHRHGTTLRGLMLEQEIDADEFLEFVHDIDHTPIDPNPELGLAIKALPGRKLIYTNGSRKHAEAVANRLGIAEHFEDIFDIVDKFSHPLAQLRYTFLQPKETNQKYSAALYRDLIAVLVIRSGTCWEVAQAVSTNIVFRHQVFAACCEIYTRQVPCNTRLSIDVGGFCRSFATLNSLQCG